MQMSQTVMQQRLLMTLVDSLFNFCMSCTFGRTGRVETSSSGSYGITGLVFSPATSDRSMIVGTVHPRLSGHVGQPFSKILTG